MKEIKLLDINGKQFSLLESKQVAIWIGVDDKKLYLDQQTAKELVHYLNNFIEKGYLE